MSFMNTFKSNFSQKSKKAFTLIEIMVATVIMVVLTGLVIQITSEVLKVWNRSSGKLSANSQARIALDVLTQDLETAVFRNNGMRWMVAETKEVDGPSGLRPATTKLLLFTPALDRPRTEPGTGTPGTPIPGDICGVSYELVYQDPVSGEDDDEDNLFALHRRVVDAKTTFNTLMGTPYQETFQSWKDAVVPSSVTGLLYPETSDAEFYLAGNVADFKITFYVVDDDTPGGTEFTGANLRFNGDAATAGAEASGAPVEMRMPLAYADIRLVVLSDEGASILRNLDLGRGGTGYSSPKDEQDVITEHGEVYTRRVNFLARPL
jgi:prepilin-type N-terminal cleavage/methylation domain-containing protein